MFPNEILQQVSENQINKLFCYLMLRILYYILAKNIDHGLLIAITIINIFNYSLKYNFF